MRTLLIFCLLLFSLPNFACDCRKLRNSDFKSQVRYFDAIVSGTVQGDNKWLSITKVYSGNINSDSLNLWIGSCDEVFINDSTVNYIIGLTQDHNNPNQFSASMCVTDVLVVEQGIVKVGQFNNLSAWKQTIKGKRTELELVEFEERLKKWL